MSFSTNPTDRRSSPGRVRAHDTDTTGSRECTAPTAERRSGPLDDGVLARAAIDAPGDPPGYRMVVPVTARDVARVESDVSRTDRVAEALIERSGEYDVTVLGAPTRGLLTQFVFGTVPDSVKRRSERRVVMAKRNTGKTSVYDRWIAGDGIETTEGRPLSRADETAPEETRGD